MDNVRVSFEEVSGVATVRQENSYYPFGLIMPGGYATSQPNKNLYNAGSEWQDDFPNLPDYSQTFYRNYDAALGRFIAVDPMAESSESMTTYQYALNNPIMFNDPLGDVASISSHRIGPGSGNHWSDGIGFKDWTLDGGSDTYRAGLGAGFWDTGGGALTNGSSIISPNSPNGYYDFESQRESAASWTNVLGNIKESWAREMMASIIGKNNLDAIGSKGTWVSFNINQGSNANQGGQPRPGWDVDGNGQLWQIEANRWYRMGNGQAITIAASSVNLKNINPSIAKGWKVNSRHQIRLLSENFFSDGTVFGTLDVDYLGNNQVSIVSNMYDFEIGADKGHPWKGEFFRNISTWLGGQVATGFGMAPGTGTPYLIKFNGTATLGQGPQ